MMRLKVIMPVLWALLSLLFVSSAALAQGKSLDAPGRTYGIGQPKTERDLPQGRLRKDLEKLPPKARGKALRWLQGFSFPAEDLQSLRVDREGGIHYADTLVPQAADVTELAQATPTNSAVDPSQVFKLHSKPDSNNVVYLDFDGHIIEGTAWNYYSEDVLVALPFDPSNNDSPKTSANFTQDELNRIAEIWHRMSEDFAAFDIDITTEEPAVFTDTTGRVLFTHDSDASGFAMPSQNAGGVAYVNAFGQSYYNYYSPALVYYTNLYTNSHGYPTLVAEAGSHELGHNLGLGHDGVVNGTSYYSGHGSGMVDWGPIMGNSYSRNVTQWSNGEYTNANNSQDDLAIIAGQLGYNPDDHGDSAGQATALSVDENGSILVSGPDLDPDSVLTENKGVIDDRDDVDWFYFDVSGTGSMTLKATPAWYSFTRNDLRGSNLDIELSLYDSNLDLIMVSEPGDDTFATVSGPVSAGRYYVQIDGVSNYSNSNYSDYASMGMYFIEGTLPTGAVEADVTPPSPPTMAWETAPYSTGTSTIAMTAVSATDESGVVEYNFSCVAGGDGCISSGWQSDTSHTANGLQADTYYAYKVTARDAFGNTNGSSGTMGATTEAEVAPPPPPPPPPDPETNEAPVAVAAYNPDPAVISKGKSAEVTLDGTGSYDLDGTIASWVWKDSNGATVGSGSNVALRLKEGSFNYILTVTDDKGATDSSAITVSVTKGGGDDGGGGGGGGGKGKPPKK